MKIHAIIFDLDDTFMPEESVVASAFEATCAAAEDENSINRMDLCSSIRERSRQLWQECPIRSYCRKIGISSLGRSVGRFSR